MLSKFKCVIPVLILILFSLSYSGTGKNINYADSVKATYPVYSTELVGPYLQGPSPVSMRVNWKTTQGNNPTVYYGTSPGQLNLTKTGTTQNLGSLGGKSYLYHTVNLTGLSPNSIYYYMVVCGTAQSAVFQFRTLPDLSNNDGIIRAVVFGDHQISSNTHYQAMLDIARVHVQDRYGVHFSEAVNFIINDGDQVDYGTLDHYQNIHFGKSKIWISNVPTYTAVGNHDAYSDSNLDNYAAHFNWINSSSYNGILPTGRNNSEFYSQKIGNILLVSLSSENWNTTHYNWTQNIMQAAQNDADIKWVLTVHHKPPYAESYTTDVSSYFRDTVVPMMNNYPKRVLDITAHHHLYARGQYKEAPVYHIISGADSHFQHWDLGGDKGDHALVQKTLCQWAYQIIEWDLNNNKMTVESFAVGDYYETHDSSGPRRYYWEKNDEFHRVLNAVKPEKPSVTNDLSSPIAFPFTFTSSAFSSTEIEELNTTWFQISRNSGFTNLASESYRDFENWFYENTSTHKPLDQNAGVNILQLTVNSHESGDFYIRVRHRDKNTLWSDWSDGKMFTVSGGSADPAVYSNKENYSFGEAINLEYFNGSGEYYAWIGIYEAHINPGDENCPSWDYIDVNGVFAGSVSESGRRHGWYYGVQFEDYGYTEYSPRKYFYIGMIPSLSVTPYEYASGSNVPVYVTNSPALKTDNAGDVLQVFLEGKTRADAVATINARTFITSGSSGSANIASLPDGFYQTNYFTHTLDMSPSVPAKFQVGQYPASLSSSKKIFRIGENVPAYIRGGTDAPDDWVGIYKAETPLDQADSENGYRYQYVYNPFDDLVFSGTDQISGVPQEPHAYKLAYFKDSGYTLVSNLYYFHIGYNPLSPDTTNAVGGTEIEISFIPDSTWVANIDSVTVNGLLIDPAKYSVTESLIVFDNTVFTTGGDHEVRVTSLDSGFVPSTCVQTIYQPGIPANIRTSVSGTFLIIDWDETDYTDSYDVYSSNDPYGSFSFEANVTTNQYIVTTGTSKKFYYIVSKNAMR